MKKENEAKRGEKRREAKKRTDGGVKGFLGRHKTLLESLAVAVMLAAVVAVIVMSHRLEPIPEGYFVSDDNKLVLSLTPELSAFEENEEYEPMLTHVVYYNNGTDKIRDLKVYYEYENDDEARVANDNVTIAGKNWATGKRLNGKYIMFTVKPEQYRSLTTAEVSDNISTMNAAGGLNLDEETGGLDLDEETGGLNLDEESE